MSKHQEILDYLENLAIGKRVSVRSISNHLQVSEGTAYRAIKEAENRGIVETKPRSGTVRIAHATKVPIEKLTYHEIARISDSEVLAGQSGLSHEFSKFSIGAMTRENISRYLVQGGLLIVGDRENIQLLALENHNAILVTGGFGVSNRVIKTADHLGIPVMVTHYDTFTVATMINHALSDVRIKTDLKTVNQVYQNKDHYGYLRTSDTVKDFNQLVKQSKHVRFPVVDESGCVLGVISVKDTVGKSSDMLMSELMSRDVIVAKPHMSLANISQKMIFEDLNMLPVVEEDKHLLGVITRRQAMENLPKSQPREIYTVSDQIMTNLHYEKGDYCLIVEPSLIDHSGSLAQGVLTEILHTITTRKLTKKMSKTIIVEHLSIHFVQAVQIDDILHIRPTIISEKRRSALLDFQVCLDDQLVAKALLSVKIT
ncbi:CBS-HotDog domain-containing transcription factor SpxR [Streptococcus sp. zg-JUN1979]|uniref:CBS-HotDog domain-containing transcription factor SpxR n=1 Tax=Streptococcus sp. zg-JUN1979 TaxID=3391450 RepID=UPI0039A62118